MKEIKNTEKLILFEEIKKSVKNIFRQNKDDEEQEKVLIYKIEKGNIIYEYDSDFVKKIVVENTEEFPFF
ncbi:hypothetical protein QNH98_07285 [Myroides sp. mNGS23_01]|nr:hypothetical protein [Myroides sp. mNGS23_01]WHT40377.1 hypothetical protein QNH98_07285 [Myroides sp. mNGS23_01]